jgi:hypothetical protein
MPRLLLSILLAVSAPAFGGAALASTEPPSPYTAIIDQVVAAWPPKTRLNPPPEDHDHPLRLRCYRTVGEDFYVGVGQWMTIHAPFSEVAKVLDDFEHYAELFPDLERVKVLSREGDKVQTFWEGHVPVFFIPNVKYRMEYKIAMPQPDRKVYSYTLLDGNKIRHSDGVIVIETAPGGGTLYTELDFVDADWGILKTLSPGRIWEDSVGGIFASDEAILLKAEHADWNYEKIRKTSQERLKAYPIASCIRERSAFSAADFLK